MKFFQYLKLFDIIYFLSTLYFFLHQSENAQRFKLVDIFYQN